MYSRILVLDPSGSTTPSFIENSFDPALTLISTYTTYHELCVALLTSQKYTLELDPTDKRLKLTENLGEQDIFYSIGIIINQEFADAQNAKEINTLLDTLDDSKLINNANFDEINNVILQRCYHLNPIILNLSYTRFSYNKNKSLINNHLIPNLKLIDKFINNRFMRIQTWIGLLDQDQDKNDQSFTLYSMPNLIQKYRFDAESLDCLHFDTIAVEIDYKSLLTLTHKDESYYSNVVNQWGFPAHNLNIDELLLCGYYMLFPSLKSVFNTTESRLLSYLFFIRDNYRIGNPFHNFRHAIDVLQACHYMVTQLSLSRNEELKLSTDEVCSLYLASLGHDLGHPGITNAFLINFNTPLAKTYNNTSVLENFHYLQFKHITDVTFNITSYIDDVKLREKFTKISKSSILATDMANHDKFVNEINLFQDYENSLDKKIMLCSLLIKCADISNVCRPLTISAKWGLSLGDEFKEVASLENILSPNADESTLSKELSNLRNKQEEVTMITQIESANSAVQIRPTLCDSQLFFIDRFARDFFTRISQNITGLEFLLETLNSNTEFWKSEKKSL